MRPTLGRIYLHVRQALGPRHVDITVPHYFEDRSALRMSTAGGRDHIALQLSRSGWSSFEAPLPSLIGALCQRCKGAFFDVGANTGVYSLVAARASTSIVIHAFEPYRPAADILRANVRLNQADSRISVCEQALSDRTGSQSLYLPLQDHGLLESSASLNKAFKPEHSDVLNVPVTTVDVYVEETGIVQVGLLKIDVESAEHLVLAGSADIVEKHRPLIVAEVLHLADHERLNQFCAVSGYRVFTLQTDSVIERNRVEFHGDAWNQCFCPEERVDLLRDTADVAGLRLSSL